MKGIITHEESQVITSAFRNKGHTFFSNDLKPTSGKNPEWHFTGDFKDAFWSLSNNTGSAYFDFFGAHPDCTYLTNAGIRWLTSKTPRDGYTWVEEHQRFVNLERWDKMVEACDHFLTVYNFLMLVGRGYIENPKMHPYAMKIIGIPSTQFVHPYYFGSPQMKETHLWIVGLPPLVADNRLTKPNKKDNYKEWVAWQDCWTASPGPKRAEQRSKTDPNFARATAEQWG